MLILLISSQKCRPIDSDQSRFGLLVRQIVFDNLPIEYKNSVATRRNRIFFSVRKMDNDNFAFCSVAVIRQHTNDLHVCIFHFCGEFPCVRLHTPIVKHPDNAYILEALVAGWPRVACKKKELIFIFISSRVVFRFSFFAVCAARWCSFAPPTLLP